MLGGVLIEARGRSDSGGEYVKFWSIYHKYLVHIDVLLVFEKN